MDFEALHRSVFGAWWLRFPDRLDGLHELFESRGRGSGSALQGPRVGGVVKQQAQQSSRKGPRSSEGRLGNGWQLSLKLNIAPSVCCVFRDV